MYCVMRASAPSLYSVYRRYDIAGNNVTNIVIHVYVYICQDEIRDSLPSTSTSECSRQQPTSIRPSCLMVPGYEDDYVDDSPS